MAFQALTETDLRRREWLAVAASALLAGCGTARRRPLAGPLTNVAAFSGPAPPGGLPAGWQEQVLRRDLPRTHYRVDERDDRRVLHASADRSTSGLRCEVDIDPIATPWLSWSWRVESVECDATVAADELDDSPARAIVAFDGDGSELTLRDRMFAELVETLTGYAMPYAMLMYVWDGQAPPESVYTYPRSTRVRYLVVESGTANVGRWLGYRRNVVEDYRRVFGTEPGRIRSVGVMTDTDDLKTRAEAWYGDLRFSTSCRPTDPRLVCTGSVAR